MQVKKVSKRNTLFQLIQTLKSNRTKRFREGLCVVESVKAIKVALHNDWTLKYLCFDASRSLSSWSENLLKSKLPQNLVALNTELFSELSDKEDGSELIAVFEVKNRDFNSLDLPEEFKLVLLDNVASPGNLGSIIRTADAFGFDGVITMGHATDIYDPKCIRASLGCCFSTPCMQIPNVQPLVEKLKDLSPSIIGTSAKEGNLISHFNPEGSIVLCFGNETRGIGKSIAQICNTWLTIPMQGAASSLNLACAASIVMNACANVAPSN